MLGRKPKELLLYENLQFNMTTDQKGLDDPNALPSFAIPELSDRAPLTQKAEGTADTDRLDPERDFSQSLPIAGLVVLSRSD